MVILCYDLFMEKKKKSELATLAAGCFWGVEETFRKLPGVIETQVGYTGGNCPDPTYEMVCSATTGHAEALQVTFDPAVIRYEKLLEVFWDHHNPTTRNAQGPDIGDQYRSAIFTHSPEQQKIADESKRQLSASGKWKSPIVTEIVTAGIFYPAEDYHQKYLMKRGMGACHY